MQNQLTSYERVHRKQASWALATEETDERITALSLQQIALQLVVSYVPECMTSYDNTRKRSKAICSRRSLKEVKRVTDLFCYPY